MSYLFLSVKAKPSSLNDTPDSVDTISKFDGLDVKSSAISVANALSAGHDEDESGLQELDVVDPELEVVAVVDADASAANDVNANKVCLM